MSDDPQVSGLKSQVSPQHSLLRRFRSDAKQRLPLHPLERAVLTVVALHLCFLPWALGTMHPWSQITSLSLSLLTFTLALIPRTYSGDYGLPWSTARPAPPLSDERYQLSGRPSPITNNSQPITYQPHKRLVRFPLFWIGLLLLAYIAIQGYNPSWVWERNEKSWWLRRVNDIPWLPTSIDTPFERFNLWRQFIIYASAWLTVCAVWVGFTRRRSLEVLLLVVLGNAAALAAFGGLQRVTGEFYIHDLLKATITSGSFASFIYHNHVGAYLALVTTLALAFACRHAFGRHDPSRRSTPAPVFFLIAAALAVTVVLTRSRGAALTLAGLAVLTFLFVALPGLFRRQSTGTSRWVTLSVATLFVATLGLTIHWLNFDSVVKKFERAIEQREVEANIRSRLLAHQAAYEFLNDHGIRGVGAGGFRYYFPEYVKRYPEIYRTYGNRVAFWEHAHNDWLQVPIELGAAGSLLLIFGGGWWLLGLVRRRAWRNPLVLVLLLGCGQTLAHAWFDFPFQCPAILTTWCVLALIAFRWAELDEAR